MRRLSNALDHMLRATGDPIRDLEGIDAGQPGHLRASVIRAAVGVLAKVPDTLPAISRAIRAADQPSLPSRLRAHMEAARLWVQGDALAAAQRYADIARQRPRDLLALRLALSCYFFVGESERSCALADEIVGAWRTDAHGFGFVLAMASFAHAECGHAARAEELGRSALARDPSCPMGVHAVAHALAHAGQPGRGAQWMRAQRAHWSVRSRMRTHNAWHLAMFDADDGNLVSALAIVDTCLLPAAHSSPVDACDASTLLWRLADRGMNVGDRWLALSDAFQRQWSGGFWPYVDLHAAITHLRAGQGARIDRLLREVERYASANHPAALRARSITLPFLRPISIWGSGDLHTAVAALRDLRPSVAAAGGSKLQLEILTTLAGDAASGRGAAWPGAPRRMQGGGHTDPECGGADARLAQAWRRTLPLLASTDILDSTSP